MKLKNGLYPENWKEIAIRIKTKANWTCLKCGAKEGRKTPSGHIVILTVHHKDSNPMNCNDSNLIALCRKCHLYEQMKLKPYATRQQATFLYKK